MLTKKLHSAHPLLLGLLVSAAATLASYLLPEAYASSGVAFVFLGATYLLALPVGGPHPPEHYGLSLGGLMDPSPLSVGRLLGETTRAIVQGTLVAAIVLIPFYFGFVFWYSPSESFELDRALATPEGTGIVSFLTTTVAWHLLGVALPEEAFFRGYLQTAVDDRSASFVSIAGRRFGWSIVVVSVLFAAGHFATSPHLARLAVFFPSLLFGVVRTWTGGIGAAVVLHAECNVFSQVLGQGYGLY